MKTVKLTFELDFDSIEKLYKSYFWTNVLYPTIGSNKVLSFEVKEEG